MSNVLTKSFVPIIAGDPGTPPTPPSPAYCVDTVTYQETYGITIVRDPVTGKVSIMAYSTGVKPVTTTQCYPATPGSPGIPPSPPTPADYNAGWNAGARSIASLVASGDYTFSVPTDSAGVVTGLNDASNNTSYQEIEHAFYLTSGTWKILEKGVVVGPSGSFASADVFKISRVGAQVQYFKGATLLYTSLAPSVGTVFADSALYLGNDQIVNAALTDTSATVGNTGSMGLVLPGMEGGFSERAGTMGGELGQMALYMADADRPELRGVLDSMVGLFGAEGGIPGLFGVLPGMEGEFVVSDASTVECVLPGMTGYLDSGLLAPDFSTMNLLLQPMSGITVALAGLSAQLSGVMGGMRGFFSDQANVAGVQPGLPVTAVDMLGDWEGRGGDQLRMMTGFFIDQDAVDAGAAATQTMIVLPMLKVNASIMTANTMRGRVNLPHPLTTYFAMGTQVNAVLPMFTVDAHGVFENVLRVNVLLPMMWAYGTGTVGTVFGTPDPYPSEHYAMALPSLKAHGHVSGRSGGAAVLPLLVIAGRIVTDAALDGAARLPRLRVRAHLITPLTIDPQNPLGRTLQGHVVLPAIQRLKHAHGAVLLPLLRVSSRTLLSTTEVAARIGYAMNIRTGGVTEFTNFPFRAMGRAFNRYWGVGMDGNLYQMGGDLDDVAPIDWEWLSGLNDFGAWGMKAAMAVYIRGVFENGAVVKFVTDDAVREYDHKAAGDYKNQKVHRVSLGRGVRTDSMAFGMYNPLGGYLELDKVTPEYRIIPRNL